MNRIRMSLLLALFVLALGAPAAHAFEIAVEDDGVLVSQDTYNREAALSQARDLGARYIRVGIVWSDYRRNGLARYDSLIAAARRYGMQLQVYLYGTPRYDRGDRAISYNRPDPRRFAAWARTVAAHFRGRVFRYSIWNEPNLAQFLSPARQGPQLYRRLYLAAYSAIKSVNRRNQVFVGELAAQKRAFAWMRGVGRGLKTDGFAYHPYQFFVAPGRRDTRFLGISNTPTIKAGVRSLARDGYVRTPAGRPAPIYYTEFSYPVAAPYPTPESLRSRWIPQAFALAKRAGIRQVSYYKLTRRPGSNWDSGILNPDGSPTPSYDALRRARRQLLGF
jgi:hypothetical protein